MLLTIESYRAWEAYGIDGAFKAIKEAGFDGVDLSFYWKAAPAFCGEDYRENALKIKAALKKYGLVCNQAHAPFDYLCGMARDESCFEYISIVRAIEACGIIGIDHIVVHGVAVPEGPVSRSSIEYNLEYFRSLEPVAQANGVKIAVENLSGSCTYPDLWSEQLTQLDSPNFVGLVDVGHAWLRANMQPGVFIRRVKPGFLKGLHVQDNHGVERMLDEHLAPGLGTIDFDDLLAALREVGYDGDFTLELPRFLDFYAGMGLLDNALRFACEIGRSLIAKL